MSTLIFYLEFAETHCEKRTEYTAYRDYPGQQAESDNFLCHDLIINGQLC